MQQFRCALPCPKKVDIGSPRFSVGVGIKLPFRPWCGIHFAVIAHDGLRV